jgi:hypothetical protein
MDTSYDTGFEEGSMVAANTIIAYLTRIGQASIANTIRAAWEDGSILNMDTAGPPPAPAKPTPAFSKKDARMSGYTGDECTHCYSLRVKRNGSCLVCESCGNTTGCS